MGYVIGHELVHSIDNNGRQWSKDGSLDPVMDSASGAKFERWGRIPIVGKFLNNFMGAFKTGKRHVYRICIARISP